MQLDEEFPYMMGQLKRKIILFYQIEIKNAIERFKQKDLQQLRNREDLTTILAVNQNSKTDEVDDAWEDLDNDD